MSVRIAVIGVGHLGKHHARILSALPGVELVGVVDTNDARAEEMAAADRTRVRSLDAATLLGHVDAVTVAVPTESASERSRCRFCSRHRRAGREADARDRWTRPTR